MESAPYARTKYLSGWSSAMVLPIVIGCSLLFTGRAWGAAKQFIPKYVDFSADLGVGSLYESDKVESTSTSTRSDLTIQEGLNVQGLGYIYSPLFISMATSVTLGLQQEQIDNNGDKSSYYDGNANQFKQEFKILPSHPYNLELYFLRATPMTAGTAGSSGSVVIYEQGARARYDERPWSSTLSYTNHDSSGSFSSDNQSLLYNLNYFQTGTNVSGTYNHNTSSNNDGAEDTTRDMYNLNFIKKLGKVRFNSRWTHDEHDQEDSYYDALPSSSFMEEDELYGEVDVELPHNFDTILSYLNSDRNSTYFRDTGTLESYTETQYYNFRLHHRLYKSLNSSFSAGKQTTDAIGGNTDQQNYRLAFDYAKQIPWGNVLAGVWDGISYIDNNGAPVTLFETHTVDTGLNFFTLKYQTIEPASIEVRILDYNNNDRTILLTEGIHYLVTPFPNSFRITIINLPLDGLVDPDGNIWDYSYKVDYSFVPADYNLRNKDWGASLQVALFNSLITPHYSYIQNDQKVMDGWFPGDPAHVKTHSLGVGFNAYPFNGDMTQSWLRSNTTDEDRLASYVSYSREITANTSGQLRLSFEDVQTTQYELGNVGPTTDLSEQFYSAQAQIQTVLPQKNMNASLATNYTLYQGLGDSTNISFFSSLIWHVGLLDLNVTASYTSAEANVGATSSSRQFTMIRFMIKRKLF
ncbi:MAG: hypothetical protein KKC76_08035 [Proteobacteria bacterium]|nr:hypothetical protein [Pseudomonadota bacterium]MBU4297187.1 hypothetical protein [Pseudomonadota bacterium]MCG2748790.1 hypothetical protein [Desulfobulbaceae bacterium]